MKTDYFNTVLNKLKKVPYLPKWLIFGIDFVLTFVAFTFAYLICFGFKNSPFDQQSFWILAIICIVVTGFFFLLFKTFQSVMRYSGFRDVMRIFNAFFFANITLLILTLILVHHNHYFQQLFFSSINLSNQFIWLLYIINFMLAFCFVFSLKMVVRLLFDRANSIESTYRKNIPVLIYGVEQENVDLAHLLNHMQTVKYDVVGFLSTEGDAVNKRISNKPIYSVQNAFNNGKFRDQFQAIVIEPRHIERSEKQRIAEYCNKYKKEILSAPPIEDWSNNKLKVSELKKVKVEELLQRIPINIDTKSIAKNLKGKTVLITGAAGSIGSEIVRQVSKFDVGLLVLCDVAESPLHEISLEMNDKYPSIKYKAILCNVRDYTLMKSIFEKYKPDMVYHAAAYKHVPLMEEHPCEAILTNVWGTKNIADLAVEYNAEAFVMISTDKAVNPSNVMGASKRIAEMYVQSLSKQLKAEKGDQATRFITTRFGNVLGSNGSVIPRFEQQIRAGGPITVTHPEITRYFMTITEACRLVMDAGNFGKGGEIFVFDMGDKVKIKDMAEEMIRLSGLEPYKDINIVFSGLRPGEKLYEELLYDAEKLIPTHNRKIRIGAVCECDRDQLLNALTQLIEFANARSTVDVVKVMKDIVPEFISMNSRYEDLDKTQ
ncbi:MAG: polysaccharide biosynthesis protein [Candidatus Symbiothrix sp.]|jgi:FlaA1/EpsC-like NDP-sugar epimerase|nr:polysaccharide biosynthesis protein [Candidatus Symbiothrix sp.]